MNRSDTEQPEFDNSASNEVENSEIVQGDESNLPPVTGFAEEDTDLVEVQSDVVPEFVDQVPVEDQPVAVIEEALEPVSSTPDGVENVVIQTETVKPEPALTGWQRVQRFFMGGSSDNIARLHNLTQSIEDAPESSVNYVLRAELYMSMREYALAQLDFQRAYELADTHYDLADWGLMEQVMRDRALTGLEKVQRRLR